MSKRHLQAFQPPIGFRDDQVELLAKAQKAFLELATFIDEQVPTTLQKDKIFASLEEAKAHVDQAIRVGRSIVIPDVLFRIMAKVEVQDDRVARLWFNAYDYADVPKFCKDYLDVISDVTKIRQGIVALVNMAEIRLSRKIPQGFVVPIGEAAGDSDLEAGWEPSPEQLVRII